MTNYSSRPIRFTTFTHRLVRADCSGEDITSDSGAVLPREIDPRLPSAESRARHSANQRRNKWIRRD